MAEEGAPTLYTTDDTGNYVEYTPPEPPAFSETLPEDIRENEHLQGVEDSSTLARYYVDLKKDYLAPPENPDGYDFEKPEGFNATDDEIARFKSVAFENGINQKQFDSLMKLNVDAQKETIEAWNKSVADKQAQFEDELRKDWGSDYDRNLEAARSIRNHETISSDNFRQFLEDSRFGDHPEVIRFMHKLSTLISEDAFGQPGTGNNESGPQLGEDGKPMLSFPSMDNK